MSLLRMVTGLWKNQEETSENAKDPALRTRYYKEASDKVVETLLRVVEQKLPNWKVVHVDKARGEIMAEKDGWLGKNDLVIAVYKLSPMRTAVDVVSAKRGAGGDLGASYRNVVEFFQALHSEMKPE